jgi:hypothetical protein
MPRTSFSVKSHGRRTARAKKIIAIHQVCANQQLVRFS